VFVEKVLKKLFPNVPRGQEKWAPQTSALEVPPRRVTSERVKHKHDRHLTGNSMYSVFPSDLRGTGECLLLGSLWKRNFAEVSTAVVGGAGVFLPTSSGASRTHLWKEADSGTSQAYVRWQCIFC
jgi:hypothetical protein